MKKKLNRRLSRISNLEELRTERARVGMQIELKEFELKHDWEFVKGFFTLDNLLNSVLGGNQLSLLWDGLVAGANAIGSLFGGKKKRRKKLCCGED